MTRAIAILCAALVCSAFKLTAQSASHPPQERSAGVAGLEFLGTNSPMQPLTKLPAMAEARSCPVQMQALQGSGRGLLVARDSQNEGKTQTNQPSQRIHLILTQSSAQPIVQARVLVRGFGPKARMEHALSRGDGTTILSRTLVVRMRAEGKGEAAGELVLPGFTSVQSIDLLALHYDDGSSWNALLRAPCSVTPDPLMLIADR